MSGVVRRFAAVATLIAMPVALATAQARGAERFGILSRGQVAPMTGPRQVAWLPNGQGYLERKRDSASGETTFWRVDPVTGKATELFDTSTQVKLIAEYSRVSGTADRKLPFDRFEYERNGKAISFKAGGDGYLFDLGTQTIRKLLLPKQVGPLDQATPNAGQFSPDFNYYAFVRDYDNLFLCDTRTGQESRLSTGTSEDNLMGFLNAGPWFAWSPDSRHLAFFKANQQGLYKYPFLKDVKQRATVEYSRYPFTTDPNPALELFVIDVATKAEVKVDASTVEQPFLRDIEWFYDGSELTYQVLNQWESRLTLKAADPVSGKARTILVDADSSYLDPPQFRQLKDGKRFTWSSERTGWRHIYLYDRQGNQLRQLTQGEWVTKDVLAVDEAGGWIYFTGTANDGLERHLFRVKLDGSGLTRLTPDAGDHSVSMDPAAKFFLDLGSSLTTPPEVTIRAADGKLLKTLATTNVTQVKALGLAAPELLALKAANGSSMQGILFKPADFNPAKKYPLVVSVYGGPHTKAIRNSYQTTTFEAALAQLGFLVVQFDGRGTLDRGKRWQTANYLRLGQEDVDDQAAAVRQLWSRPYVDSARVGVTGGSHGGFMTIAMKLRYPDVFGVGVAVVPLTNLELGPRQYIGRFMRTPEANPDGYAKANFASRAKDLKGRLLIVHGTDDHSTPFVNTMQFVRKAVDAGRPIDMMVYPLGHHGFSGADAAHNAKTTAELLSGLASARRMGSYPGCDMAVIQQIR